MFYGPPGSGKGTQANLIKEEFQTKFLDFGAEFREFIELHLNKPEDPEAWRASRIREYLLKGPIFTEDLEYIIGKVLVDGVMSKENFVTDKCGVLPAESKWLSQLLKDQAIPSVLFHLPLDLETSIERINHRYYIPGDKLPYPSYEEALKHCMPGVEPVRREGESEAHTMERYDTMYRNNCTEILSIWRAQKHSEVIEIDASLDIDHLHRLVKENLKLLGYLVEV